MAAKINVSFQLLEDPNPTMSLRVGYESQASRSLDLGGRRNRDKTRAFVRDVITHPFDSLLSANRPR